VGDGESKLIRKRWLMGQKKAIGGLAVGNNSQDPSGIFHNIL
jgi:hypothetical protein